MRTRRATTEPFFRDVQPKAAVSENLENREVGLGNGWGYTKLLPGSGVFQSVRAPDARAGSEMSRLGSPASRTGAGNESSREAQREVRHLLPDLIPDSRRIINYANSMRSDHTMSNPVIASSQPAVVPRKRNTSDTSTVARAIHAIARRHRH